MLDLPASWAPLRLIEALLYGNMSNPQILRYWGVASFVAMLLVLAYAAHRLIRPKWSYVFTLGAALAPLSIGVLPFLLTLNRAEQVVVMALLIGCFLPFLMGKPRHGLAGTLALVFVYGFLSWIMMAAHMKAIFLLPALLAAGWFAVTRLLPWLAMVALAGFSAVQTYLLWSARTDCPEVPRLTEYFQSATLRPADLISHFGRFLYQAASNAYNSFAYWRSGEFQAAYQSDWLPAAASPIGGIEHLANSLIPIGWIAVIGTVVFTVLAAVKRTVRPDAFPDARLIVAAMLGLGIAAIAVFQVHKAFYEGGLLIPILAIAFVLSIPALLDMMPKVRSALAAAVAVICVISFGSEIALAQRFAVNLPQWRENLEKRPVRQAALRKVLERCGVAPDEKSGRIVADDFSYSVVWPSWRPYLMTYFHGYWANGSDQSQVVRAAKITAIVGMCSGFPTNYRPGAVSDGMFCCKKIAH